MATVSNYALRVPPYLMEELKERAAKESTSVNQLILMAVAEKLASLRTRDYFRERAGRAGPDTLDEILSRTGSEPPAAGDDLPEDWRPAPPDRR